MSVELLIDNIYILWICPSMSSILQYCLSINVSVESQSSWCITEMNIQDNQIKVKFDSHTDSLSKKLNILKFPDICKLQMGQFIFSFFCFVYVTFMLDLYFLSMFVMLCLA